MIEKFSKFEDKNKTTTKTRWEKSNLEFCSFELQILLNYNIAIFTIQYFSISICDCQ